MKMPDLAWQKFKTSTVVNCFAKAGISKKQQNAALEDDDDPFKELQKQMDKLAVCAPNFFPDGITAEDVISADDNVLSTEPLLTDDEIIDDIMDDETVEDAMNDDDDASREPICPKASDVRNALGGFA